MANINCAERPDAQVVKWFTRWTQNPLAERPCEFDSRPGHKKTYTLVEPYLLGLFILNQEFYLLDFFLIFDFILLCPSKTNLIVPSDFFFQEILGL